MWVLAMAAAAGAARTSQAQNRYWVDGVASGNWSVAANWSALPGGVGGAGVPTSTDVARITHANATNYNVTLNVGASVQGLLIGNTGSGIDTLTESNGSGVTTSAYFGVGSGAGVPRGLVVHSAGTNTIGGLLQVGLDSGGFGTYNLSNAGAVAITNTAGGINVGYLGAGVFNQSAGTVALGIAGALDPGVPLYVASQPGSSGTYNLSGGSVTVYGRVIVAGQGAGTFNQSGGTFFAQGRNTFVVGDSGAGTYIMSGGTFTISGTNTGLNLAQNTSGSATFNLINGVMTCPSLGAETVGVRGTAVFSQTGGSNSPGYLEIGTGDGSHGTYTLSAGSLAALQVDIANHGLGTFNQTGGSNLISSVLYVGGNFAGIGGSGTYILGGSGVLSVAGQEQIGNFNVSGTFIQNGGTHTLTGSASLSIAYGSGTTGAYYLNGGVLTAPTIYVGGNDSATGGVGSLIVASGATLSVSGTLKAWNAGYVQLASPTRVGAVSTSANGKIDLTNSGMVVDYASGDPSPLSSVRALLVSGSAGGAWNGPGINSSTAAAAAMTMGAKKTAVGYAEASDLFTAFPATFLGQSVDNSSVLLRYTFAGDNDLSGNVDLTDFTFLAAHFNQIGGATWLDGDYNYDGNVDLTDFTFLASNFNQSLPAGDASPGAVGATVPEPMSALLLIAPLILARSHRRVRAARVIA